MPRLEFGVHNDEFNLDYYHNGEVRIYKYNDGVELITTFSPEVMGVFMAIMQRDGYADFLIKIDEKRLNATGFTKDRIKRLEKLYGNKEN